MSSETPLDQDQKDALANATKKPTGDKKQQNQDDVSSSLGYDLSRSYGRNWTKTNVHTLFDWLTVAAFNMQCLEYAIEKHRASIRNFTIYGLLVSTLSGTISLSQFGIESGHVSNKILQGIFTFFTFSLAIYTGYIKIYQIQERLEQFIKLRQDWAVFATTIASELQLPIDLRRDALHLIIKYKSIYLDLIKIDIEIPENLRIRAEQSLPKTESHIQVANLPSTIINIGIQEMDDLNRERLLDKDRFSVTKTEATKKNEVVEEHNIEKPTDIKRSSMILRRSSITKPSINQLVVVKPPMPPETFMLEVSSPKPSPIPMSLEVIPETAMYDTMETIKITDITGATGTAIPNLHPLEEHPKQ